MSEKLVFRIMMTYHVPRLSRRSCPDEDHVSTPTINEVVRDCTSQLPSLELVVVRNVDVDHLRCWSGYCQGDKGKECNG